ncbi:uncharacterized protein LOC107485690 [Arachis duranensis]|uniref:Uncharacterized protein LOC107485690 n=1 Tax=Arachis duranensis TaxID=130453 RepID=A0A6P5NI62_ARADU|nr:uncharacterized protein LOC107485690 [Arachis duranensis]
MAAARGGASSARGGATSMRGPIDLFVRRPETAIVRNKREKLRQQNIKEACNKEAVRRVHQYIARWFYQAGIPLNPVKLKSFQEMLCAVGSFGPNLPAPNYHTLRLLNEELEYTKGLLNGLGIMFLKSIDASDYVKTGENLFELFDDVVEEIGEHNVVQVVTNNGSNYVLAVTRFATSFLSLERLFEEKGNMRRIFTSDEWAKNKLSKEAKGREATKIVIMSSFWNHVKYTLKIMGPLVRVLRLVDGEKKPPMGYIYEAMEKAKECIMKAFLNDESKYNDVFKIIDNRWNCRLHRPLHAAGHFLNPELFYDNPRIKLDLEVTKGWFECITRLVPSQAVQQKILEEQALYKAGYGLFGPDFAKSQRKKISLDKIDVRKCRMASRNMGHMLQPENQRLQWFGTLQRLCRWNALSDLRVGLRRVRVETDK